ncbi:MAG TPA: acyl-CoA dehydrogenase [Acidimicrobiia bacterium]|nr:acyl-CoA dehydrogenase [Acidimicrobiia bacterium]
MDFSWSEEDELLRETVRRYATERLAPDYARWEREPFPRERVKELGDLGLLGMLIPPEYGGSNGNGGGYVSFGIAAEEIGRADFNVTSFLQLAGITAGLLAQGSEDVRKEWLPGVASGELVVAFALTEPGVGSDAARLSVTARRDGADLVLSGEKASCTFAGLADSCVVFARTGGAGAAGISMVLVPLDRPGVTRRAYDSVGGKLTQRGSLFFDDVRVPAANQLGAEGAGFVGAMQGFDFNRSIIALACIGTALQSLDETIAYAKERTTFGKPLARHEGVAFPIAEHLALLHATRLLAYEALARADAGQPHTTQAAMAKWLGPKQAAEAIHSCLLFHGWTGYGNDIPFAQRYRDIVGFEIGDGTAEIMKAIIAREAFGREFAAYR